MSNNSTFQDWENLVKKQLKVDDIYAVLQKENLENLEVKPFYNTVEKPLTNLPKVEESTHLVSFYDEKWEEDAFAFYINQNVDGLQEKTLFFDDKAYAETVVIEKSNKYISLIDVFNHKTGEINQEVATSLLNKGFDRALSINISGYQNAGASIVQQVGIALGKAKELIEVFGPEVLNKIVVKVAVGAQYFFEIAKIRALKLAFFQLSKEFGLETIPYIFAETTLRNKSIEDSENNLIRSTLELSAAMIAGADAIYSNDYKLNEETALSKEISFKQQIVLAYESIINVFEDASNGSYYVEDLTQQIVSKGYQYFIEIENQGGFIEAMKTGSIQKEIYLQGTTEQQWVNEGKIKLIGVNLYPQLEVKNQPESLYSETEIKPVRWAQAFE